MKKSSLLYVSPFWPQRSGISEYSEKLVWGLKEYFDITLITKGNTISNQLIIKEFHVLTYRKNSDYSNYDYIIYNFGNSPENHSYMYDMLNKYPGYVILHDFTLYYLTIDYYKQKNKLFQKIYELEGTSGIALIKDSIKEKGNTDLLQHKELPPLLPLNQEILNNSKGLIVHSNYVKKKILEKYPRCHVHKIELIDCMPDVSLDNENYLRKKYHFNEDDYIIGAVGLIALSKQNKITCEAVNAYNKNHSKKVRYVMIGQGDYVDSYLNKNIIKTGYIENREFFNAIKSCNIIFNLRFPYNGESSAALMQCLSMGKQCVVTDIGWFSELSDDFVKKVPFDISISELVEVIESCMQLEANNSKGQKFTQDKCNCKKVAHSIQRFLLQE